MRSFNLGHRESVSYPMTTLPTIPTLMVSPRVGKSHGVERPSDAQVLEECIEVKKVTDEVKKGKWPGWYMQKYFGRSDMSAIMAKYTGCDEATVMKAVQWIGMDHPFDLWNKVVVPYCRDNGIKTKASTYGVPFTQGVLMTARCHAAIAKALDAAFDVKYFYGICRPSEVYDPSISIIPTPNHPSYCAGHGAFGSASFACFEHFFNANTEQMNEMRYATLQFAQWRTLAGVHTFSDNDVGWKLGYRIASELLLANHLD